MPKTVVEPVAVARGEGLSVENPAGGTITFKLVADESGGVLTVIEATAAPGEGPPLHLHPGQDEVIYVLAGEFRIKLADDLIDAPAGSFVFIPRGTPHTWQNVGDAPARFFATLMPAATGFEEFFMRYAALPPEERGLEAFARISSETEAMEVLGPPLAQSDPI
jgi:quercetin dioxygenase-like cupin family protein